MNNLRIHAKTIPVGAVFLTFFLAFFAAWDVAAQAGFPLKCGSMSAPPPNGSNPDSLIHDRFGNVYDIEDLLVPPAGGGDGGGCQSGFFNLTFDVDFPLNLQPTVCQVFADLSAMIGEHSNTLACGDVIPSSAVDIDIVWQALAPSNILGTGTPFYSGPLDATCNEMILDRPFIKINGGIINPFFTEIFDGRLVINADPTNAAGNIHYPWHQNWNTPIGLNEVDLYSVTLHEALHILGFASRIGQTEYTLWDRILHITNNFVPNGVSPNVIPILTNSPGALPCTGSLNNCWALKSPEVTNGNLPTLIANTCGPNNVLPDVVVGAMPIAAVDWANGGGIQAALSHLSETCNNAADIYVMRGGFTPGMSRRVISQDELQIMCEIGYEIGSPNYSCSGCYNIANQDRNYIEDAACCFKTYYACAGETLEVLNEELLCNDVTNGPQQIITRLWQALTGGQTIFPVPNASGTGWIIQIPANYSNNQAIMLYTVMGCDCRQHNAQFIISVDQQCPPCTFTPDPCDNLLCVGDFENFTNSNGIESHLDWPITFQNADVAGTPDIIATNLGNHYLFLGNYTPNREAVNLELQKCIEPGCALTMSMDLSSNTAALTFLEVWGSETRPCDATIIGANQIAHNCGQPTQCDLLNSFEPICVFENEFVALSQQMGNNNPNFTTVGPFTWLNQTTEDVCFLTLVPSGGVGIYLDNISAQIICEPEITCEETALDEVCQGGIANITFQICAPDIPECLNLTLVTPTVVLPPGWTLIGGNPGPFTLTEGQCQTITLQVQVPSNAPIGSMEMIMLSGTATGLCTTVEWSCSANVTVIDCVQQQVFTCPCPAGGLNIDASENSPHYDPNLGGTRYSDLEADFNYDQNNNGRIDQNEHNDCIAILGNLIIDQNLGIWACDNVQMQPCSKITVGTDAPPYRTLNLISNTIYSCEIMWHGITITPHSRLNIIANRIRDAQFAVNAIGGIVQAGVLPTILDSRGNTYSNNHIGVFFPGSAANIVAHIPFVGNTFTSTADLLPPCDAGLLNYSSTLRGFAGVLTQGTPLSVGANAFGNNFSFIRNGVLGNNAVVNVNRSDFQNIIGFTPSIPGIANARGNGVAAFGGSATVLNSNFNIVTRGVLGVRNQNLTVRLNTMPVVWRGVETSQVHSSAISDNLSIGFAGTGILCRDVVPANGLNAHSIENNTNMFVSQFPGIGLAYYAAIDIDNVMSSDAGSASITNNHFFSGGNFSDGIRLNGSGGWDIDGNTIDFQAPASPFFSNSGEGIRLSNTHENYLYQNHVNDFDLSLRQSIGMSLAVGTGNRYCCNNTFGNKIGSYFFGACGSTEWRVTDMLKHTLALSCAAGTVISPQSDYGDNFNATSGMAFHGGQDFEVLNSQFRVLNMQQPHWPEAIATPNATAQFFTQPGYDASCTAPCTAPMYAPPPPDRDIDESDLTTATGGYSSGQYSASLQWESGRRLYERMSDYEGMIGTNTATDAFYTTAMNGKIGAYYQAEYAAKIIYNYPPSIANGLQTSAAQLESNRLAVEATLAELAQAQTTADSALIYANTNTLYLSGQAAAEGLQNYQAQAQAFSSTQAFNAYLTINSLTADNILEQNRKTVQLIYVQTLGMGIDQLTQQQLADVEAIAIQCPLEGGSAVYAARALYRLNIDRLFIDDSLCIETQERKQVQTKPVEHSEIYLLPNPATDMVTVAGLAASAENPAMIQLVDANGALRLEHKVAERDWSFSAASLPSGIYFFRVQLGDAKPVVLKLVVSH